MTAKETATGGRSAPTGNGGGAAKAVPLVDQSQFMPMPGLDNDDRSKDELFVRLAFVADAMIKAHGKDFTMGALVLAARFIAEGKPLVKRKPETEASGS